MERSHPRRPDREDVNGGLAYALWLPHHHRPPQTALPNRPWPGVVIVHGAGSRKENHADFARLATAGGWAALAFDLPGHGDSEPPMSGEAVNDVIAMARLLASQDGVDATRVAVRGSSLGGFLAIHAAAASQEIAAVVAICPAGEDHLASGLRRGSLEMRVGDPAPLEACRGRHADPERSLRGALRAGRGTAQAHRRPRRSAPDRAARSRAPGCGPALGRARAGAGKSRRW